MPTLSNDMIAEIEETMSDLVEELNEVRRQNASLKAQLQQLMSDRSLEVYSGTE